MKKKVIPADKIKVGCLSEETLLQEVSSMDVISFDVFDTLIFRPFCAPTDLFLEVGRRLGIPDFERIRREMEGLARQQKHEATGSYEVTLADIYKQIEYRVGIPAELGMQVEIETELDFCYANPYMLDLVQRLFVENEARREHFRQTGEHTKILRFICTTDMYLPGKVISQMLEKCGYPRFDMVFVSCEVGASKADGALYRHVMTVLGEDNSYLHIGDNPESDVKNAQKAGWQAIHYPNVNVTGMPYRAEDMSIMSGSLYRGLVNTFLYAGNRKFSKDYELGFTYGGQFILGYCQFIHRYAVDHGIDKILFLSRDGDILYQVYKRLYGEGEIPIQYVYWSRNAATKLMARYNRYDYLRRFVDHKVNQGITLQDILASMGVDAPMILEEAGLDARAKLDGKNAKPFKEALLSNWKLIEDVYAEELEGAGKYYATVLDSCHHVAAVDVGWAGSGALALDFLCRHAWNIPCDVVGILAGTNTANNYEVNATEQFLYSGKLVSYLFSQEQNREYWKWHNPGKDHNLLVELLLCSAEGSLKGFTADGEPIFKKPDVPAQRVQDIQQGIRDYVDWYMGHLPREFVDMHEISGGDAYAVLRILLQSNLETELEMGV